MPNESELEEELLATICELEQREELLKTSLKEMLDCYWGVGDGHEPPEFIQRAYKLIA